MKKKTRLVHEVFLPFDQALRLYDAALELATTHRRLINDRLAAHAMRMLDHVGCAGAEPPGPARRRMLQYGRLSMTRLATTVEAARRSRLISQENAERVHALMLALEEALTSASSEQPGPTPVSPERGEDKKSTPSPMSDELSPDELADLRELIERDSSPSNDPLNGEVALGRGG